MAQFSVSSGVLTIGAVVYCASDVSIDYSTESLSFLCMDANTPSKFVGQEEWSGSATLAYADTGMDALRGLSGTFSFVVTTSTAATITLTGNVVISSANSSFSKNDVPTMEISFEGNGDLTEAIS
jgi:hypothetical protein